MYVVKKYKGPEQSKGIVKLVEVVKTYRTWGPSGSVNTYKSHYEFHLIEQGIVIEKMHARDVYDQCPTHDTYEKFIHHWLSDQEAHTKSTLDLTCTFSKPKRTRILPREFESDSDNHE